MSMVAMARLRLAGAVVLAGAVALTVSACGDSSKQTTKPAVPPLRVTMVSLAADTGYPGPATRTVTLWQGYKRFASVARLVRLPLPEPLTRPKTGVTICVPVMLTIRLSDRRDRVYRACQRPRELRPIIAALCPILAGRSFCHRYRSELM